MRRSEDAALTSERFPNLFLAGAPKCGTTSLMHWLAQHPGIFAPLMKEPAYFASDFTTSTATMSRSSYLELYEERGDVPYAIDASTHYFHSRVAAERIARDCPDARILILLRNPVDAAYSLFHQLRYNGTEALTVFEDSLAAERARAADLHPVKRGFPENLLYSRVYDFKGNIERFLLHFPRQQLAVLLLDDMRRDPRKMFEWILAWLSLDTSAAADIHFDTSNAAKTFRARFLNDLAYYPHTIAGHGLGISV